MHAKTIIFKIILCRKYLSDQTEPELPHLSLNLEQAASNAKHLFDINKNQMYLPFSQLWTPLGYLLLTKIYNFLDLACDFGESLRLDKDEVDRLRLVQLKEELSQCLMHRNM